MLSLNPFKTQPTDTADDIIARFVKWAGGIGAAGAVTMHADVLVLGFLWTLMILALARHHGVKMDKPGAIKIATALTTSAATFTAGYCAATVYFSWTVIGAPVVMAANFAVDAILTCAAGVIVSLVFASGKDNGPGGTKERILTMFRIVLGRLSWELIKEWVKNGGSPAALQRLLSVSGSNGGLPALPSR